MERKFRNEEEMNIYIEKIVNSINRELEKEGYCDFKVHCLDNGRGAIIEISKLDYKLKDLNINAYNVLAEKMFYMDGYGYEVIKFLEKFYKKLNGTEFNNVADFENKFKKFLI